MAIIDSGCSSVDGQFDCVTDAGETTHVLSRLEVSGGKKAVVVKHSNTEALVTKVRSTMGLDTASCATGALLYTVSTATTTGEGPVRVLDATPGSGGCAGDELNDATLTSNGVSSYRFADWGVTITVVANNGHGCDITVALT
ncbi:hypothetical protein F4782DRAFT_532468 [Xylaria castorea]|nr:hypothetical protein F4782DRAFT_532468 [Xylaria castorea]